MRILVLSHYWSPELGAPQSRWEWLAQGLSERGHRLNVLAPAPHYPGGRLLPGREPLAPGTVGRDACGALVHRTVFRPYGTGLAARSLDQLLAAADSLRRGLVMFRAGAKPDVIIGTVPGLPTLPTALSLGAALRRPVVIELRDAWPDVLDSVSSWTLPTCRDSDATPFTRLRHGPARAARQILPGTVTWMEREAAALVTTTESFARVLRQRGMRQVVTVPNSPRSVSWPLPGPPATREDGRLHVLYLGTVGRAQGILTAVRAADLARRAGTALTLRIVGEGSEREAARAEARRLGAPVDFLPPVPPHEIASQYSWADSGLVTLQDWPAMELTVPSKLYELIGAGLHVSAAVAGEAAEIVRRSRCGDVVAPQDPQALASLWKSLAADRSRLVVTGGRDWLSRHSSRTTLLDRYEGLLEQVRHV